MDPLIINIKRNSLDDGPGIRTVIFFKGCPLSCVWCQNPEAKRRDQEIKYNREDCIKCETCVKVCPNKAINMELEYPIIKERCDLCGECINSCDYDGLTFTGHQYAIDELVDIIEKDIIFYKNSNGGITLSGGEPTLYPDFLNKLLRKVKEKGIHVCLETSGYYNPKEFEDKILPFVDLIYFDLKIFNSELHEKYCGVKNTKILENFEVLINQKIDVLPRIPLIPEITTKPDNLKAIAKYLKSLNIKSIGLLPYNPLWLSKIKTLGREISYSRSEWMTKKEKEEVMDIFKEFKFKPI